MTIYHNLKPRTPEPDPDRWQVRLIWISALALPLSMWWGFFKLIGWML